MSNVEQLLSLCELAGTVSMSRREWEQRFPAQWRHLQLVLDSCDDLSEVVPRVDDPTQMLDVVSLPDGTLVACDPHMRTVVERASHTACEMWQLNAEKLIRLVCSLIDGAEVKGPAHLPLWHFGRWPSTVGHTLPLYVALPSHRSELSSMIRECAVPGGTAATAVFTWTDRYWSADVLKLAQAAGIIMIPISEILVCGLAGWCLSPTWSSFRSAIQKCMDTSTSRQRQGVGSGKPRRVRTNVAARLNKAINEVRAEIHRRHQRLREGERRGEDVSFPRYTNKELAATLSVEGYVITRLCKSPGGDKLKRMIEIANDPLRLEANGVSKTDDADCT
jgi:hypothetical protein